MRILIDSHTMLWAAAGAPQLSARARRVLEEGSTDIVVSLATIWELSIKIAKGKLRLAMLPEEIASRLGADLLPVRLEHISAMRELPPLHGDPFDRMLIAQAMVEGVPLLSGDRDIARYDVPVIW